jgi:prepilin-type processing-associated H-X9-DG protein
MEMGEAQGLSAATCFKLKDGGYAANNGMFVRDGVPTPETVNTVANKSVTDGTSNTMMIGESAFGPADNEDLNMRPWALGAVGEYLYNVRNMSYPLNIAHRTSSIDPKRSDVGCGSHHSNGAHFGFADGSVHFINDGISLRTLYYLASRQSDDVISEQIN